MERKSNKDISIQNTVNQNRMLSQRSTENRSILREEWSIVHNNKEILYVVKHGKYILRYWWDGKNKETFRDWENLCGK